MELKDRIAAARKAAGLTQEQLGELVGVTRQAVSKWEAGQTVPDAVTVAALCEALHVSADYVLLGKEPEDAESSAPAEPAYTLPDTCPCCGRAVEGTICPVCGYTLPAQPPRGGRFAVLAIKYFARYREEQIEQLIRYCGLSRPEVELLLTRMDQYGSYTLLRRDLTDSAAHWLTAHLDRDSFTMKIVQDDGEEDDALLTKPKAMELPTPANPSGGIGFWGVVGAVVVALLILSFL